MVSGDANQLREQSRDVETRLTRIRSDIYEQGCREFNIDSPKQLQQVLFVESVWSSGQDEDRRQHRYGSARAPRTCIPCRRWILQHRVLTKLKEHTYGPPKW